MRHSETDPAAIMWMIMGMGFVTIVQGQRLLQETEHVGIMWMTMETVCVTTV